MIRSLKILNYINSFRDIRRRLLTFVVVVLATVFSGLGCFSVEQEMYVNEDGSGRGVIKYSGVENLIRGSPFMKFFDPSAPGLELDRGALAEHFADYEGVELRKVDVWTEGDQRVVRLHVDFDNISSMSERDVKYSWDVEGEYKVFRIDIIKRGKKRDIDENKPANHALKKSFTENGFVFKAHLPRKIIDSNAVSVDWNAASWFVPLSFYLSKEGANMSLYARTKATTWERVVDWIDDFLPF